jgi:8-oxo-dGTP pyrophosphatase MutT (NUDIX family)
VSAEAGRPASPTAPLPSSTLILLREGWGAPFEVLMVKRHGSVTFPGVHAFPGGVLEAGDASASGASAPDGQTWAPDATADRPPDALRFWIAALRETFEEVGILLAYRDGRLLAGPLPPDVLARRTELHAGRAFADVLADLGAVPASDRLFSFARWVTPSANPRRFDTRFLVTRVPPGQEPIVDGTETEASEWLTPAAALAAYERERIDLIPPTVRTLDDLARFADVEAVLTSARRRAVCPACPEIVAEGERLTMRYPSPCPDDPLPARRLVLDGRRWRPLPD